MSALEDDPYAVAAREGLRVDLPGPYELFIDIDSQEDREHYDAMRAILIQNGIEIVSERETPSSKSAERHSHIRLVLNSPEPLTPIERIALQACLGSDRKRELLSWLRIRLKLDRPPTVFFERESDPAEPEER